MKKPTPNKSYIVVSGEIAHHTKIKVNMSKDIEEFDQRLTQYLPEKHRRKRMRQQKIAKTETGGIRIEEPVGFNPGMMISDGCMNIPTCHNFEIY